MTEHSGEEFASSSSCTALVPLNNHNLQLKIDESIMNTPLIFPLLDVPPFSLSATDHELIKKSYSPHDIVKKLQPRKDFCKRFARDPYHMDPVSEQVWVAGNSGLVKITERNKIQRLCDAVSQNDASLVQNLIKFCHVSPNCFDSHKRTPLHIAVSKGYLEIVQYLLNAGANPNAKDGLGNSCLHLAACTNNVEMAIILINGGASKNAVDIRGRNPIQLAQSRLKVLQRCPDCFIKSEVEQVIKLLMMCLKTDADNNNEETAALLSGFQTRLQITDSPEQVSSEIDNLNKLLNQMETLRI